MQTLCTHVLCLLNWRNYTSEVATVKYKVLFENTEKLEDQRQRSAQKLVWAKYRNCTKIRPDLVPNLTHFLNIGNINAVRYRDEILTSILNQLDVDELACGYFRQDLTPCVVFLFSFLS